DADRSPSTLAVEDAGPSGPARLVRNQADSSSWKIGSSIVSSTKGAAGGSAGAVVAAGPAGAPATVSSPRTFGISVVMSRAAASSPGTAGGVGVASSSELTGGQAGGAEPGGVITGSPCGRGRVAAGGDDTGN